jgi:hypothetical protein
MAGDFTDVVRSQEEKLVSVIGRLEDADQGEPGRRRTLRDEARARIDIHAELGERHLLPLLEQLSGRTEDAAELRRSRQRSLSCFADLEAVDPCDGQFRVVAKAVSAEIRALVEHERRALLSRLDRDVPPPQRQLLRDTIEREVAEMEAAWLPRAEP